MPDILPPTDLHLDGYKGPRVAPVAPFIDELRCAPEAKYTPTPTPSETKRLNTEAAAKKAQEAMELGLESWKPKDNLNATSDPLKTLFVGRLVLHRVLCCKFSELFRLMMLPSVS
jgi:hypothetical protein